MLYYPKAPDVQNTTLIGTWNDSEIPIYDVPDMHSLNQLVGYVKHINAGNGTVLYRGQCDLYKSVSPSIYHDLTDKDANIEKLNDSINSVLGDSPCLHFLGFRNETVGGWELYEKLVIEAALQHYGAKTFCVDFVDNHWTALWFGLYKWNAKDNKYEQRANNDVLGKSKYICYDKSYAKKGYPIEPILESIELSEQRLQTLEQDASHGTISLEELIRRNKNTKWKIEHKKWENACRKIDEYNLSIDSKESSSHMYLFLYVADTNVPCIHGLYFGSDTYTIDLRKALPSTFLRPCSQHGWIVKGKEPKYDFNNNVVCVVRISIDLAKSMLGNGTLLSQENFFPRAEIDQGYKILLERQNESGVKSKYPKILPEGMIVDFEKKN